MKDNEKMEEEQNDIYAAFNTDTEVVENDSNDKKEIINNFFATNASKKSRLILYGFYLMVIVIAIIIYFMFRSDRYEFYLVKDEISISNGSSYQVELTPKNVRYFDYLNYKYEIADKNIATVDEFGTVTAVGTGLTTLKISLSPGFVSKTMKINAEGVDVQEINLFVYKENKLQKNSTANMIVDESLTLKAVANNDDNLFINVQYESNNPDVATVDSFGNVTAKARGIAVISGTKNDIVGEITIVVTANDASPVDEPGDDAPPITTPTPKPAGSLTSISLGSSLVTKYIGESISFKIKTNPSNAVVKKVTWSSNNTKVATVTDKGVVKAVGKGTAIITVNVDGKMTTCTVIVKEKPSSTPVVPAKEAPAGTQIKANEVTLNKTSLVVNKGKTGTFTIKVSGAAGSILVSSSDSKIATVKVSSSECSGLECFFDAQVGSESSITYTVTGVSAGTAYINVKLTDLATYNDAVLTGSGKIGVLVK